MTRRSAKNGARVQPDSATMTMLSSLKQVTQKNAGSQDLLCLLAFLHPDTLHETCLREGAAVLPKRLRSMLTDPTTFQEISTDLLRFSLLDPEPSPTDTAILRLRPSVQQAMLDSLPRKRQCYWARQAVRMGNALFPVVCMDTWAACEQFLSQAQHCATLIRDFHLTMKEGGLLLERLGFYLYQRGRYAEAKTYLTQALQIQEIYHSRPDVANTAQTLNSLGLLSERQARYQEAEAFHQRAWDLREQDLGSVHSKATTSLHNLADATFDQGRYAEAEVLYLRVLALEADSGLATGVEHAKTLNNLGALSFQQARYEEAEAFYHQALALCEGRDDRSSQLFQTYPIAGLGSICEVRGDYEQAESYYQRVLVLQKHILGEEDSEIAHSLSDLADVAELQGHDQRAELLYQQAIAIGEQTVGPRHPDVALFLNNLALLATKHEEYQKAEPLFQRARSIYEDALGSEHPHVASVLTNLGRLLRKIGQQQDAEAYLRRALTIYEKTLDTTHPQIVESLSNLAEVLIDQQRYEEAEPLLQHAFALSLQLTEKPGHPYSDSADVPETYARLLEQMNKGEEAARVRQTPHTIERSNVTIVLKAQSQERTQHMPLENPHQNETLFPLQVLLKERTKIQVTHFPKTMSREEKFRNITMLYEELRSPTGVEQRNENISAQESQGEERDEEEQAKRFFAQEFLMYAEQTGAEAMAILLTDKKSTVFISTHPDAATQNREDMLTALRKMYPHLSS